ncbi:MAG: alginate export family protein [Planctomycetota bacterium]
MTGRIAGSLLLFLGLTALAAGQEAPPEPTPAELLERIRKLEEEVRGLRGAQPQPKEPAAEPEWRLSEPEAPAPQPKAKEEAPAVEEGHAGYYGEHFNYGYHGGGPLSWDLPKGMRLRLGGAIRTRGEFRQPRDLRIPGQAGRPASDDASQGDDFELLRTRVSLDLQAHRHLRAFIEFQDSRTWGDAPADVDASGFDLRQGFVELAEPFDWPLWVWVGRWKVPDLGDGRLISGLDFSNVTRSWDGVQVFGHLGDTEGGGPWLWVTAFAANVREGRVFAPKGDQNDDFWFSGLYATVHGLNGYTLDLYVFWRHLSDRVFAGETRVTPGNKEDVTLGARSNHDFGWVGYSMEFAWQAGNQNRDRIRAIAGAGRVWVKWAYAEDAHLALTVEYAYASGDKNPADGRNNTFDPLVPNTHDLHGQQDLFRWSNLHDVSLQLRWALPVSDLSLHSDLHAFFLDERKDAWYGTSGVVRRDLSGQAHGFVGTELDLYASAVLWERLTAKLNYSHFWPGRYVRETARNTTGRGGTGAEQDWVSLSLELAF